MTLIGLTGGIASGKSTIGRHLQSLGAVRIDADQLARDAVSPGSSGLERIRKAFGDEVIDGAGALDRSALGALVFGSPERLAVLNGIVHPAVRELAAERIRAAREADPSGVVVYEVPLLVEAGVEMPWDLVVVAEAPDDVRRERLERLRGLTRDEAERRIASQASNAERRAVADVVVDTGGEEAETLAQVEALWERVSGSEA